MFSTRQLRDEHEGIKVMLSVLELQARSINEGGEASLEHLGAIIDFLRTFIDKCHHGKEEEILFPALANAGVPSRGGPIGAMMAEHERGREFVGAMEEYLAHMMNGEKEAFAGFSWAALEYAGLLRAHIAKENSILFPMAERFLSRKEHQRIIEGFDRLEQEKIGPGTHERYHGLIHELKEIYLDPLERKAQVNVQIKESF